MQQDAADKRSPAYSAQEAEGDVSRSIHHEYLKTLNLMINAELRLLCCEICQVAILPSTAKTHVKVEHSQREFDAVKFAEAVAEEGIPSDLPNLSGPRSRVKGLAVKDAIACGLCDKVLTNIKGMHNHHSEAHEGFAMPREWRACKAQRLRNGGPGTHQVLWEVDSYVETEDQTEQLIRGIMKDMESVLQVVEAPQDERKVSPWLLTTCWHEHLAGQQADDLMGLVAIPKEDDELMPQLKKHVYAYFEGALALLSTTDELTLQRLNSPDPMKNGISNTPFHRHQEKDTMQKYILPIVALLAMLMRSNPCVPFHFSKTRELQDMTEALSISLEYGQEEATVSSHIHELLIFIWTMKWKQNDQNLIADLTELCLALLTAQKDGSFKEPKDVTGIIAKDEYCMRATFVKEIKDRVTKGVAADEEEACNALEPWFTEKTNSTFSRLRSLQHRASSIAFDTMSLPKLIWTDGIHWTTMLYKGNRIDLKDTCEMFAETEERLVDLWENKVLKGLQIRTDYDFIADDLTNRDVGYSFLTDQRNEVFARRDRLLEAFFKNEKILEEFAAVREGQLVWNRGALIRWLQSYAELHSLLLLCCEMLSGAPGRGTELTAMMYRNTRTRTTRNLVILGKHVTMLCMYSKTSALTGKDKLIPHSLDAVTSDILIQDLALARPFAEVAAHICFPGDSAMKDRYRNQLFVNFRKLFDSDHLSAVMMRYSLPHLNYKLTINSWRHIQTAWKRKFKCSTEELIEEDGKDSVEALQAGHSRSTENRVYGLSMQAMAGAAEDVLPLFLNTSTTWQIKCKTFPGGQFLSYHQARSRDFEKAQQTLDENKRAPAYPAPDGQSRMRSTEDIVRKVVEQLTPMLTSVIQAAVQEAVSADSDAQQHHSDAATSEPQISARAPISDLAAPSGPCKSKLAPIPDLTASSGPPISERAHILNLMPPVTVAATSSRQLHQKSDQAQALQVMRKLLRDESASWKSEQQQEAMRVVLEGKRDAVVVLRTGGGKSMLAIIPSLLEKASATVLVLPLNSLMMDFERRLTSMRVPFQIYDRNRNEGALNIRDNLILVTADKARSERWREALAVLNEKKPVKRMVFDESHIPLIANDYRDSLQDIYDLRSIPMQIICLSGTLTPSCIPDLISSFGLVEDTQVIRQSTNREELIYILEK
ncbi:hypothetical protein F4604DRAFT_1591328, partial [Suillus subluteus]